ncbi:MAG TPA: quinate 5-dehydrogenase [Anaerolineae bacterium]|nr:quinate 5-dehydrogenase [Anaerolineae bacterium]
MVSISLGSSGRNKKVTVKFGDDPILIERIGVDGDEKKARALFAEMDGKVDALGVGGVELYILLKGKEYPLRSGLGLIKDVHQTPAVDGRGLKHTLERRVMQVIEPQLDEPISPKKAMMTLGVDRIGMAESLAEAGYDTVFCDLMFGLGVPVPIYGLKNLYRVGRMLLPVAGQLPISMIYPTGESQETITPKYQKYFNYGPVIAGDFLYIRKHLPEDLKGRMIVTNTTTTADVELLKSRGLKYLATTTPVFEGRSFGTNMLEAALTAYAGKGRTLTQAELSALLDELNIKPTLQKLNE